MCPKSDAYRHQTLVGPCLDPLAGLDQVASLLAFSLILTYRAEGSYYFEHDVRFYSKFCDHYIGATTWQYRRLFRPLRTLNATLLNPTPAIHEVLCQTTSNSPIHAHRRTPTFCRQNSATSLHTFTKHETISSLPYSLSSLKPRPFSLKSEVLRPSRVSSRRRAEA